MSHYTAITIGPIYKTMSQTRKSRHLWGASYLFSFIMKKLLTLMLTDRQLSLQASDILLPHASLPDIQLKTYAGTGLYPDRLFVKDKKKLIAERVPVYQKNIFDLLISKAGNRYEDFFHNYLRIYSVSYHLPITVATELSAETSDYANIIWAGNKLLDSAELKEKYYPDITGIVWNEIIDDLNGKLLYNDAFDSVTLDYQFPSVIEIATDDFQQRNKPRYSELVREFLRNKKEEENDQQKFLDALTVDASFFKGLTVRPYHKYMAVVQADGDNIGKTIAAIGRLEADINIFSKALFDFALKASDAINRYGGKPVYVGGDDLFFFAPVAVQENNSETPEKFLITIFDLIRKLDAIFQQNIVEHEQLKHVYEKGIVKPSLSYGVSVVFAKYPLNEAKDIAYNLLQKAKEKDGDKNKICFKVLRHSGQGFGFTVDKKKAGVSSSEPRSYDYFSSLCGRVPEDAGLLSSVIFKLAPLHATLNTIGADKERMAVFFDNMFNEPHHQIPAIKNFLTKTSDYIQQVYTDFPDDMESMPEYESTERNGNLAKIYSTLRFLKMLVSDE